ncbi:hypothetical protein DW091_19620 [Eubacterium sp. AM05-23]|uniref:DUF7601 domain-containing protein n=1 Tax=Eubacterium TaxID=1730 RepID=UPI000E474457|nr:MULTISPECIES: DUF5979 domain-containing protein [Eubacterium]RHO53358.1 hypothetical protein DW091_19620 [Eubacterium sp. AM05-23]
MLFTKKEKRIITLTEKFNRKDKLKIWYKMIVSIFCFALLGVNIGSVLSGTEVYAAGFPGKRTVLESQEALEKALTEHQKQGITPAGTTVNLFDYVASKDGAKEKDLTTKVSVGSYKVAKSSEWNKGINENRLLLFGDSIIGAGYWNNGAGAGRLWAQENTNMKGIVESTLTNGYPNINIAAANKPIANVDKYQEAQLPFCLGWAANEDKQSDPKTAPGLSQTVLNNNKDHHDGNTSLDYLFDLTENDNKRSYENVTGLFQVDEDGYYYYDARKNFAEFRESTGTSKDGKPSDGSFILYDGPAVWRTDGGWDGQGFNGDRSLGDFYPFNKGEQVFDSINTEDNILSSSKGLDGSQWSSTGFQNKATGEAVNINHHMGMSMQVDFTQPENGKLNMGSSGKQDMVFQFSGDDDVWIFIDDVLVLDLGGIHSELYGTINFSTGKVVTGQSWRTGGLPGNPGENKSDTTTTLYKLFVEALGKDQTDAIHWATNDSGEKIFPTGTDHSLKLFYLERGNYDSSLQMRFNLQPSLYHGIKKVDQSGDPLEGVEFELYAATAVKDDSSDVSDYEATDDAIGTLTTGESGNASFIRTDGSPFSFTDRYHSDGTLYYILKETKTADGYRTLPKDIVLKFDPNTSMLVVANRYQTGAYASFFSNIRETGKLTYGQFNEQSGVIMPSQTELSSEPKKDGIIVAVPMLLESGMSHDDMANDGKWLALYGSNTEGYGAVSPEERTAEAWRKAVLKAALYQASDERWPEWRLTYNQDTGRLEGLLEDLPGRADRYVLNNENGDMKMVYGIIEPSALEKLDIEGNTSEELYDALEAYVSKAVETGVDKDMTSEEVIDEIVKKLNISGDNFIDRDFSFLNTDQFQREFRSTIYIPNERRELRVQKVDEDGKGVNGATFTLTGPNGSTITGTTATVDGRDGVLIFRPDTLENMPGYAQVAWEEVGSKYTLTETSSPEGYERNVTEIPVIVGVYSIYADAGTQGDGVTVMAGVGKLMQTMTKYAADDMVNITLRDITAIAQTQETAKFDLSGWRDDLLEGTQIPRSMNLHYGVNAVVNYGLHDEDGGKNIYPFFTTDVGFLRTRVVQNTAALKDKLYGGSNNTANWDDLSGRDLTSLFSLMNTVVVTNKKTTPEDTGKLRISKIASGDKLSDEDYTRNFTFTVFLKNADGTALEDEYYYYGEQRAGYIKDGGTLSLRHDEALTILGLPNSTKWEILETEEKDWLVSPKSGTIEGVIKQDETANAAFTNYKGNLSLGDLTVSKVVSGNAGETDKAFNFTVTLNDKTISGTYGDMKFENGAAAFTLKHGESKTASDLPAGMSYKVIETEANQNGYVTISEGETGTISKDATAAAAFTNTKDEFGNLTVSKVVSGNAGETDKAFNFTVTLSDKTISGTYGDMTFTDGVAVLALKHGESKTASDLPTGISYKVVETEADQDGYGTISEGETGTISKDATAAAEFINTKNITPLEPDTGDLTVSKVVSGNAGETDKAFNFTVTLSDKTISGTYGDMTFTDGVAVLALKHGESKTASDLPTGISYKVVETEADQDGYVTVQTGETGTISKDATAAAEFINTKNITPLEPDTGDLTVSKVVSGNAGETDKAFNFTVTLSDKTISGTYGDMTFTDGVAAFTLKHGESKTASGLPVGIYYSVEESGNSEYKVTTSGKTGVIKDGEMAIASFNNYKEISDKLDDTTNSGSGDQTLNQLTNGTPKTGYETNLVTLWLASLGIFCSGIVAVLVVFIRKSKEKNK